MQQGDAARRGWRRCGARVVLALAFSLVMIGAGVAGGAELPVGSSPAALRLAHFPDAAHAVVWRNWNLVPVERLANVLGATAGEVRGVAASMGLPAEREVEPWVEKRLYLSIIRRNWHLLPYDQLLTLLGWTEQQLAHTLREDDFLWIKLGSLKPRCERVVYARPDGAARRQAEEIRKIVEGEMGRMLAEPAERPLAFLERFRRPAEAPPADVAARRRREGLRFLYSYFAVFGDPLLDPTLDPYPDGLLKELSEMGVNGVWLHVVLRDLAPSAAFPEFGKDAGRRLENLRKLVERAGRLGIGVYLYMNEPRAMPGAFFEKRSELAGVREGEFVAMCTSRPEVRAWLGDSLAHVFTSVPGLAGVFTITASENLTNCASHHNWKGCVRCKAREPAAIIAEVNAVIEAGVRRGSADARVIVWDWGWDAWAEQVIAELPKSAWLMSVSEWSLPLERGGVKTAVGEYSISAVGPGPRARRHWGLAGKAGLKRVAKVQVNNTWELSAVPYLPVMELVAEHCERLRGEGVDGMMLSWSLGGYPSANLRLVQRMMDGSGMTAEAALNELARARFGAAGAKHARAAWRAFSAAFQEYPYHGGVIYNCPVQLGPANLLWAKETGYRATMVGFPYDDVKGWSGPYPPAVLAGQFEKVAGEWNSGIEALEKAAGAAPAEMAGEAQREVVLARAAGVHFRSVANQVRFVLAREAVKGLSGEARAGKVGEMKGILMAEEKAARELLDLATRDSRIGFEASNQYYYLPQDLVEKVVNCRWVGEREDSRE